MKETKTKQTLVLAFKERAIERESQMHKYFQKRQTPERRRVDGVVVTQSSEWPRCLGSD